VCEASSFQLEDSTAFAPEAAVFLNFSEDHLDRHETTTAYLDAKMRIFANQHSDDLAVLNGEEGALMTGPVPARTVRFGFGPEFEARVQNGWIVWRDEPVVDVDQVRLRGRFNLRNAMAAVAVCLERGIDVEAVRSALREFSGLPHRLEHVAEIEGVEYVNDSKATNVDAAAAALESFGARGVHAILGGSLKGEPYFDDLGSPASLNCRAVYLIGEAARAIGRALREIDVEVVRCGDLEHAVREAADRAKAGEVVLLSPACASFDQYRDFEERGEHFRALVHGLT
jgi:UDP-N-acetylmuramoylalanine--D-glutamate ligase